MSKICEECGKEIILTLSRMRRFCSYNCRDLYRKRYFANYMKNKRKQDVNFISKGVVPTPPLVNNKSARKQRENSGQKMGSETYKSYGGIEWYKLAKKLCCNFHLRKLEGYCVTLTLPVKTFKPCNECTLLHLLRGKYGIKKNTKD